MSHIQLQVTEQPVGWTQGVLVLTISQHLKVRAVLPVLLSLLELWVGRYPVLKETP